MDYNRKPPLRQPVMRTDIRKKYRRKKRRMAAGLITVILIFTLTTICIGYLLKQGKIETASSLPVSQGNSGTGTDATGKDSSELSSDFVLTESSESSSKTLSSSASSKKTSSTANKSSSKAEDKEAELTENSKPLTGVVEKSKAVKDSYFKDAVFIGNSRTQGLKYYSVIPNATIYAEKGLTVKSIYSDKIVRAKDGSKQTVLDALKGEKAGKIYVMLGLNELGWPYENVFIEQYGKLVDDLIKIQPDAEIYIQLIMPVTKERSNSDKTFNNKNIDRYNQLILQMAKKKKVNCLQVGQAVSDKDGYLVANSTTDGIHITKEYCEKWYEYLKTHTVK